MNKQRELIKLVKIMGVIFVGSAVALAFIMFMAETFSQFPKHNCGCD